MIQRIVLLKLTDEGVAARESMAEESRRVLADLPGVRSVAVGLPADEASEKAWDLSFVLTFDDLDAVEAYRVHPDHRALVDGVLKPRVAVIKAWNFEI